MVDRTGARGRCKLIGRCRSRSTSHGPVCLHYNFGRSLWLTRFFSLRWVASVRPQQKLVSLHPGVRFVDGSCDCQPGKHTTARDRMICLID